MTKPLELPLKLYLAGSGEYSDWDIVGIYPDREAAEEASARANGYEERPPKMVGGWPVKDPSEKKDYMSVTPLVWEGSGWIIDREKMRREQIEAETRDLRKRQR